MNAYFNHEKLDVYRDAIQFVTWIDELLAEIPRNLAVYEQLDRASTSIPLNIAAGKGRYASVDRRRYFDIAHDGALECAACLDVLIAKHRIQKAEKGKAVIARIVSMLEDIICKTSTYRRGEPVAKYVL